MRAGTIVVLPDGRVGTVVYHGLDGYGIAWGRHVWTEEDTKKASNAFNLSGQPSKDYDLPKADALLRDPWPGCSDGMEYVGNEYELEEEKSKESEPR